MGLLNPKESGEYITKNAKFVTVDGNGIERIVKEVINGIESNVINVDNFSQQNHHPNSTDPEAINWIFLIDVLNFCFWTPGGDPKWKVENLTGYFALCAAINRARKDGVDITNPSYYTTITKNDLLNIFRSDDEITKVPLIEERLNCLHEVGKTLIDKYDGKFENCIKVANGSAKSLLQIIVDDFPCFRDEANYLGERVSIYKRAQILIGDIWACFRGQGLGHFDDIDAITMFADYRIPQVLIHFGSLKYNDTLMELLKKDTILPNGSREEIEIRGASIYIVERVKERVLEELAKNHSNLSPRNINSIVLDHFLWDYRRRFANELEYIPFHKTISVYY